MKILRYIAFAILLIVLVVIIDAVRDAHEAASQSACQGHMNQLQLALRNYESAHGQFPPAFIAGPDGMPWHSWRVLLLPFIGNGEEEVYDLYRFDEAWNGPNNSQLADKISTEYFQCHSGPDYKRTMNTNYVVVVGDDTAFPGSTSSKMDDFKDGLENTILLVEIGNSDIHWMEPRDLDFDSITFQSDPHKASSTCISSPHPAGPGVVFSDAITAYRLHKSLSLYKLRAMLTISGGEEVNKKDLKGWSNSSGRYLSEESQ